MQARHRLKSIPRSVALVIALLPGMLAVPARAAMDIANNGAVLDAGRFSMRVTNVGVMGNAFVNKGLSFDPSFEFPKGSGHECLEQAELWVGATHENGSTSVSGGPVFEFRPTLDSADVVAVRFAGDRGTRATFDDDGDGAIDEEFLDGRDNDGDGEVDEDPLPRAAERGHVLHGRPEGVGGVAYENGASGTCRCTSP
jgi:hypothetical protein